MKAYREKRDALTAKGFADYLVDVVGPSIADALQGRANLSEDDLEYTVGKVAAMKDQRLAQNIATLIGWGDNERAELETFCAVALEVMRHTPPSRMREAARLVELRALGQGARRI